MRIQFTKMQGAGNDFVVLDETQGPLGLTPAHYRFLGDRHFGVGADQILTVRPAPSPDLDFEYVIHNADGAEVEQCGNGARCFAKFVREQGLSTKDRLRVKTMKGVIEPFITSDGRVTVNMGAPEFRLEHIPFEASGLSAKAVGDWQSWPLELQSANGLDGIVEIAALSMGNPHAVLVVKEVDTAPVEQLGPLLQQHARFVRHVNAGFMQIVSRSQIRLRVFERGVGETLACGSGACAAVVAGIRWGLLDKHVDVHTRGGLLSIAWEAGASPVMMTGPATTVFRGELDLPDFV